MTGSDSSSSDNNSSTSSGSSSTSSSSEESDSSRASSGGSQGTHKRIEKKQTRSTNTTVDKSKAGINSNLRDTVAVEKGENGQYKDKSAQRKSDENVGVVATSASQDEADLKHEKEVREASQSKEDTDQDNSAKDKLVARSGEECNERQANSTVVDRKIVTSKIVQDDSQEENSRRTPEKHVNREQNEVELDGSVEKCDKNSDGTNGLMKDKEKDMDDAVSTAAVSMIGESTKPPKTICGASEHSKEQNVREKKRSRTPKRRSTSRDRQRHRRSHSKTRSRSRSYERRQKERRRSASFERRRKERQRRHAERDAMEQEKKKKLNSNENSNVNIEDNETVSDPKAKITERQRRTVDLLTSRTGGAYIPPAKLRLMQAEITDKASAAYQRIAWEALKKSIHGYINKVNVDNIAIITRELLKENIVRGRGLLCRSIIQAQAASPTFTHVYAALVAIINSKFPNIGELLLKRLVIQFKRAFRRNDKGVCLSSSRFIAHLVNQRVAHEILALEILTLLVETPTDDSVEVAIAFLKECGMKLTEVSSKGIGAIFEMLKNILHEGKLDKRVQYMIEVVFQVRKDGFKDHQSVAESLELVEEDDQFTHLLMLDEATNAEDALNAFKFDDKYETNEDKYKGLSKEILGSDGSDSDESGSGSGSDSDSNASGGSDAEKDDDKATAGDIIDNTETNMIALRRTIYLTINSSLDYEECAHKLMKMQLKPGQEIELCHMFLDCCAEQRTYEKFYGLLAQRFCAINKIYIEPFEEIFKDTYQTTHRLDTNRLRNVSKFFAHLLFTDAISWDVLECIKLNEDDTTSSSRIFIKILFQELAEYMGLGKLNSKLKDEVLTESLSGLFPKDNPRNTRFAINFFTSIGLGGLTDDLRQFLKNAPKSVPAINIEILANKPPSSSSSSLSSSSTTSSSESSSSESSSTSSTSSSSDSESSESDHKKRKRKLKSKNSSSKNKRHKNKNSKQKEKRLSKKSKSKNQRRNNSSSSNSSSDTESSESSGDQNRKKKNIKIKKKIAKSDKKEEKFEKPKTKRKIVDEQQDAIKKRRKSDEFKKEDNRNDRRVRDKKYEDNHYEHKGDYEGNTYGRNDNKRRSLQRNDQLDNARDYYKQRSRSGRASRNGSKERG